jgi:WD40 repeat protein
VEVPTQLLQVQPSPQLRITRPVGKEGMHLVRFSPDGKTLASAGPSGEVILWDVPGLERRHTLPPQGLVPDLAFTPDSKKLLVPSYELLDARAGKGVRGGVRVFDVVSGKQVALWRRDPARGVARVSVTADGKTAALMEVARDPDGKRARRTTSLWDVATGKPRAEAPGDQGLAGISADGKTLVRVGAGVGVLGDVASGKARASLTTKGEVLGQCVLRRDGRTLAGALYGGQGWSVTLWDVASGKRLVQVQPGKMASVSALALSSDGKWLAVAPGAGSRAVEAIDVGVWNVKTGQQALTLRGHILAVPGLDFHPDGKLLATASGDGTIRLWQVEP